MHKSEYDYTVGLWHPDLVLVKIPEDVSSPLSTSSSELYSRVNISGMVSIWVRRETMRPYSLTEDSDLDKNNADIDAFW